MSKEKYSGTYPSIKLTKTKQEVINDTVAWAKLIAADNSFHYGHGSGAHHNGCYFCGTQPASKKKAGIKDYEKTYCCNPFAGAAWAHGGCDSSALSLCSKGKSWGFKKGSGYDKSKLFINLGHPAKKKLQPGDVLCRDTHVAIYAGNGKIVEARGEDDNKRNSTSWKNSICVRELTDKNYSNFPRVHRYCGSVYKDLVMKYGEYSSRIGLLKDYMRWYDNSFEPTDNNLFDAGLLKAVKTFQKNEGLTITGTVGKDTLERMKNVEREVMPIIHDYPECVVVELSCEAVFTKMNTFARKYVKDNSFIYKKWTKDEKTHQCPICHKELQKTAKYKGWNSIGYVSAIVYHASGDEAIMCSCSGLVTSAFAHYDTLTLDAWRERNGCNWDLVVKQEKAIPVNELEYGDIVLCYSGKTFKHICWYVGNGYVYDSTPKKGITKRKYSDLEYIPKIAFRYTGKISVTRKYLQLGDSNMAVSRMQKILMALGFLPEENISGTWDTITENAVTEFYKKYVTTYKEGETPIRWDESCNNIVRKL